MSNKGKTEEAQPPQVAGRLPIVFWSVCREARPVGSGVAFAWGDRGSCNAVNAGATVYGSGLGTGRVSVAKCRWMAGVEAGEEDFRLSSLVRSGPRNLLAARRIEPPGLPYSAALTPPLPRWLFSPPVSRLFREDPLQGVVDHPPPQRGFPVPGQPDHDALQILGVKVPTALRLMQRVHLHAAQPAQHLVVVGKFLRFSHGPSFVSVRHPLYGKRLGHFTHIPESPQAV